MAIKTKWVATVPQTMNWDDWLKEMDVVAGGDHSKYFKIPPKSTMRGGDVLYIVHSNRIRGYLPVKTVNTHAKGFTCSTTGTEWGPGRYAELGAPFTPVDDPRPMKGFQGVRYYAR